MVLSPSSILAFCGAVFIAFQAITIKQASARARQTMAGSPAFVAAFVTIVVSVVIFWALLLVQGIPSGTFALSNIVPFVVAGALNPAAFRLLYFKGIDEVGAPIAAALMAMNPIIATIFAIPVLGEQVTVATAVGILCIVAGGIIIQSIQNAATNEPDVGTDDDRKDMVANGDTDNDLDLVTRQLAAADTQSLLAPVGAMVVFGVSYVIITVGLRGPSGPITGLTVAQTTAFVGFLGIMVGSPTVRQRVRSVNRPALGLFLIAGVFTATSQIASFFALDIGTVVTVIPLFNTFPLLVLAMSYAIAREAPRSLPVLVGVISIVVGSILVEVF